MVQDQSGEIVACWPYGIQKKYGCLVAGRPHFSLYCGPWVAPSPNESPTKQLDHYHRSLTALAAKLPAAERFFSSCCPAQDQHLALAKLGWTVKRSYSYILPTHQLTAAAIWSRMGADVRARIRKTAPPGAHIIEGHDPQLMIDFFARTAKRRGVAAFFPEAAFRRLFVACAQRQCAKYWLFTSEAGQPIAAVWLPYDQERAYLIGAAVDTTIHADLLPLGRLIWEAVQWCVAQRLVFDFEGSTLAGVEDFYRRFGPIQQAYNQVERFQGLRGHLLALWSSLRG